ncbi:uncharacterized protein [Linepithema humile]|uniref:uncharacterized protein n=1 Tax=Linepithema humile TaxID=83485 RepID=UPI00351DB24F
MQCLKQVQKGKCNENIKPEANEPCAGSEKKRPEANETCAGNVEKSPEANETCAGNLEKSPEANETCAGNLEKSPEANETCAGSLEKSPEANETCAGSLEKSPEANETCAGNVEKSPEANETCAGSLENLNVQHCEDNNYFVIESSLPDINDIHESIVESRRIVDISFMWNEIHRTFDNHARGIECQFKDWKLVNSRRCGLLTQLFFKCQMCHYKANIWSESTEPEKLDLNKATVATTITVGNGYAQLEEFCAGINIPCMSEKTYIKYREDIVDDFQKTAMESMKMAGELEKQLALERNETINGIPYITVVADGSWMKRSYGNAYDSLSGVGAIIGYRTRKVLFIGIRNKFCTVCDMAERNGFEPRRHKCYKNFDRKASSTKMESDAIVEGFKSSLEMHGLMYRTVIADGDSSVYQSIQNNAPYCEQMVTVKKIECTNHLLRNFCKKLKIVAETVQSKQHRTRGFVQLRNVVKNNILKMRKEMLEAATLRREEKVPHHSKATELQKDILNIPSHIFGEHKRCKERGRICEENHDKKQNYVPYLKAHGLYQKIESAVMYLSAYSDSLLLNLTNNPAEWFNSIICKEIGGKRINFGLRGSYNARVAGAVVQHNTQQVLTELHKTMGKDVPAIVENLEKRRQIKIAKTKEIRKVHGRLKKFNRQSGTDCYYGPQSQKPDLPPDVYEQLQENHFLKLDENAKNRQEIELQTRDQSKSDLWHSLRCQMLTASNFGTVCRMRPTTSCAATVKSILYPPHIDTSAMQYGRDMEEVARIELAAKLKKKINPCGLFVDNEYPYLGASPDGLIDEDGLVEIKCPLSAENFTVDEAIQKLPLLKGIFDKKNTDNMNRNHRFFYQVQGQLNIAQRNYCIFAIWTPKSLKTIRVNRDYVFWEKEMAPVLERFYLECMLPEILDSRHNRHMPIRDPKYITDAKEQAYKKKNCHVQKNKRSNEDENILPKNKKLKQKVLSSNATSIAAALDMEQDNDCILVSFSKSKHNLTKEEIAKRKKVLDDTIIPLSLVKENVLPVQSKLNDDSLDTFLRVVRETSCFETQSVQYLQFPELITASDSDNSLQIIGGNCTDHWRCIFFDGSKLHVYDSLPNCTYEKLAEKEKNYIRKRYPKINVSDIIFEKVQSQPDSTCCGIYAAAFATAVVLRRNPCEDKYSNDVERMRRHFMNIIENNELSLFPSQ